MNIIEAITKSQDLTLNQLNNKSVITTMNLVIATLLIFVAITIFAYIFYKTSKRISLRKRNDKYIYYIFIIPYVFSISL